MNNTVIKRTIIFDHIYNDEEDKDVILAEMNLRDWQTDCYKDECEKLKRALRVDHIIKVKPIFCDFREECHDDNLRIYIYKTGRCHVVEVDPSGASHAVQVSMGNDDSRTNWVNGENSFNAKIFISDSKRISQIVIDILLDIQMYYILAMDSLFSDFERNRKFSRQKAEYVKEKGLESYLGERIFSTW